RFSEAQVISVNLLPEHKAVLEGEQEILLHGSSLEMRLDDVTLHLQPQSFFQTNTLVARALYRQAVAWVERLRPASLWDLYCGVGGFALHCASAMLPAAHPLTLSGEAETSSTPNAAPGACRVLGVEVSEAAV